MFNTPTVSKQEFSKQNILISIAYNLEAKHWFSADKYLKHHTLIINTFNVVMTNL